MLNYKSIANALFIESISKVKIKHGMSKLSELHHFIITFASSRSGKIIIMGKSDVNQK